MSNDKKTPEPAAPSVHEMVAKALADALPLAVAAAMQAQQGAQNAAQNAFMAARVASSEKCPECGQLKKACGEKHTKMVVFPRNEEYANWFRGCFLNGVQYLSNNSNHQITVPAANDFAHQISNWERNERETVGGRKKMHNSGSIGGGNATGFVPATEGWR